MIIFYQPLRNGLEEARNFNRPLQHMDMYSTPVATLPNQNGKKGDEPKLKTLVLGENLS